MLHLGDLTAMAAVVDEGSIQAAATKLHKTPAAISQAVKRLEESLALTLFDRTGYRLTLTEQGRTFFNQAQPLLGRAQYLERYAKLLSRGQEKAYEISVHAIVPDNFYLPAVSAAADGFAETTLHIALDTATGPLLRLRNGAVDLSIAVSSNNMEPMLQDSESTLLGRLETLNVISPSLLPKGVDGAALMEWLGGVRQIVVKSTVEGDSGEQGMFPSDLYWSVSSPETKRQLISRGFGWGRLPRHLVQRELQEGIMVSLNIPGYLQPTPLNVWALRRRDRPVGPVGEAIWREITARAGQSEGTAFTDEVSGLTS